VKVVAVERGDVVLLDYTLKLKDTGEVIETTSEQVAKEVGIYSEKERYGPVIVIMGEGKLLPGMEEVLVTMDKGEERDVEIPPEKAYGPRNPALVKKYTLGEFRKAGIRRVYPGMVVEVEGRVGVVKAVSGGRVVVDLNHPYAGRTIIAKMKVIDLFKSDKDKIRKIVERRISEAEVSIEGGVVTVKVPEKYFLNENIQLVKAMIVSDLMKFVPSVKKVVFVEELKRPEEKAGDEGARERSE
jgi:peptidylprolyl isomerase